LGASQRWTMVGKSRETSNTPSARTATTEGPSQSGRHTRPARAPAVPSAGRVEELVRITVLFSTQKTSLEEKCAESRHRGDGGHRPRAAVENGAEQRADERPGGEPDRADHRRGGTGRRWEWRHRRRGGARHDQRG